jgi:methionyl-tRNA formyltransferase
VPTVYLGTSAFAADVLERLSASAHRPALVVTRPERPSGRGRRLTAPPVADTARRLHLELYQPEDVNSPEARGRIAAARPESVCVCAFGALIREPLLSAHELLNVHPSLLPRWRGAAPIERAIMAGDAQTGVSIMRLTGGLDSGPVCLAASQPIGERDTYGTLAQRLQALGAELLLQALDRRPPFLEQPEEGVTYAEKITPADRLLDPLGRPAVALERQVRALSPHIGARLLLPEGTTLGIHEAALAEELLALEPGELAAERERLLLGCARGTLELLVVQPPGRRPMSAPDYLRGRGEPGV